MWFVIFSALSLIALIILPFVAGGCYKRKINENPPKLLLFTGCSFIAIILFLSPINWLKYDDSVPVKILMTLLNTLQVFINDGSTETFKDVFEYSKDLCAVFQYSYRIYGAFLIVAAPILTFSNVLMLFKDFFEMLRFDFAKLTRRVYIMSELNNCSITLAKSIMSKDDVSESNGKRLAKKIIVFSGVDKNADSELIDAAKAMNAVVLKKVIAESDLIRLKKPAELYLIGGDDNENISRASAITEALNKKASELKKFDCELNIFAFAHSRASGCVIDSVKYDNLIDVKQISDNLDIENTDCKCPPRFRLRRVDIFRQFVWNEIKEFGFFDDKDDKRNTISILIVGFGTYGLEFFKAVSWFCHLNGRKLEINIIDRIPDIQAKLNRHCPGLMSISSINPNYSVEWFSGIDLVDTDNFSEHLNYQGPDPDQLKRAARLKRTTHVLIALGNDEADTEVAIYLREVFDRINPPKIDLDKLLDRFDKNDNWKDTNAAKHVRGKFDSAKSEIVNPISGDDTLAAELHPAIFLHELFKIVYKSELENIEEDIPDNIKYLRDLFERMALDTNKDDNKKRREKMRAAAGRAADSDNIQKDLRGFFEMLSPTSSNNDQQFVIENTDIYAVLYDDYFNSESSTQNRRLINHKRTPYNINFIGGLESKYCTKIIYDPKFEKQALKEHLHWAFVEVMSNIIGNHEKIFAKADPDPLAEIVIALTPDLRTRLISLMDPKSVEHKEFIARLTAEQLEKIFTELEHDKRGKFIKLLDSENAGHKKLIDRFAPEQSGDNDNAKKDGGKDLLPLLLNNIIQRMTPENKEKYLKNIAYKVIDYEKFEYLRLSSMSRVLYRNALSTWPDRAERNEHNRWMLYMCSEGYIYNARRNYRAKTHFDITHFENLSNEEKSKDK